MIEAAIGSRNLCCHCDRTLQSDGGGSDESSESDWQGQMLEEHVVNVVIIDDSIVARSCKCLK